MLHAVSIIHVSQVCLLQIFIYMDRAGGLCSSTQTDGKVVLPNGITHRYIGKDPVSMYLIVDKVG